MHARINVTMKNRLLQIAYTGLLVFTFGLAGIGCDSGGANGGGGNGQDTPDTSPPSTPSNLQGESKSAKVALNWEAVGSKDLGGYNVYRSTSSLGDVSGATALNESPIDNSTTYTDETAENGMTYHYVVTAVDTAANESDPSDSVQRTPFAEPPSQP